jgi:outer membrane receptor for ferrienterochelin and colicins
MKKVITIAILFPVFATAQNTFKAIIKNKKENTILPGTTVIINSLSKSAVADSSGLILMDNIPSGKQELIFSHIGFKKKELELIFPFSTNEVSEIIMENDDAEMEEIVVQTTRSFRNLNDIPTKIEVIAPDELDEKGTMKPGDIRMLLNESTGITTQQTSAVSGTANIRIQGLDGRYTQILKDGMPLYTGFSGGLSILQIPPLDLKQVEFIKGSASTLYGGGAISGLVNLITKTPATKRELNFLLNGNSGKGFDANGFYSQKWNKVGLTFFTSYNYNGPYDPTNIGFTAIPKTSRIVINPKIFFYFNQKTTAWFGVNTTFENRIGGDVNVVANKPDSIHKYFEQNKTTRISTQFNFTHIINVASSISFKNAVGIFERNLSLHNSNFHGQQISSFSELNYTFKKEKTEWVAGINEWTEKFIPQSTTEFNYNLTTIGVFVQNTLKVNNWFIVESGLRIDNNIPFTKEKLKGIFILPRVNTLFKISNTLSSRIGGGLGYKMPTPFIDDAEKIAYQNIHAIDLSTIRAEKSYGINADINYRTQFDNVKITLNQFFFYTKLNRPILLQNINYNNANGFIDTKGAETNMKIRIDELSVYLGYTYTDTRQHFNGTNNWQPLSAKHRVNFDFTYEVENSFRFGIEGFYTGKQFLSNGTTGQGFVTFGLLVQKMWKHLDVFINTENLTDRRQTRFGSIYSGSITNPVFKDIYAPLDGIVINGGVKIKI